MCDLSWASSSQLDSARTACKILVWERKFLNPVPGAYFNHGTFSHADETNYLFNGFVSPWFDFICLPSFVLEALFISILLHCFRWQVNAYCSNHFDHHHQIKCARGMALTIWCHLDQYDLGYGPSELGPLILIELSMWASWCTRKVDFFNGCFSLWKPGFHIEGLDLVCLCLVCFGIWRGFDWIKMGLGCFYCMH